MEETGLPYRRPFFSLFILLLNGGGGQAGLREPTDGAPEGCGGVDAERESEGFSRCKVNGQTFE